MECKKTRLRNEYILLRKNIKDKKEKSSIIVRKILELEEFKESNIIALYKSIGSEVDTSELIEYSITLGKTIVLPKVEEDELKFYKINGINERLVKSKFGIKEPLGEKEKYIDNSYIDLVIVPGISFDLNKNRLGFGKGFYDRFLSKKDFNSIGISFEEQVVDNIPTQSNDIKVKKVITDKRIIL